MSSIIEYFQALERLKSNKPINVPLGTKINNDNIALEAGRSKGSIKKSRPQFSILIEEIKKAQIKPESKIDTLTLKLSKTKKELLCYKQKHEESIGREVVLLEKIDQLEKELKNVSKKNIIVLKKPV